MNYQFLLMRHAKSRHNKEKDQWKQRYNDKSYKLLPEYRLSKFSPSLIDSSEIDFSQCQLAKNIHIDLEQIAIILCSPLRRCLQTCKHIVSDKKHLKVIVQPMLCSRIAAAWSISSPVQFLEEKYPHFDFTLLKQASEDWMLSLLSSQNDELSFEELQLKGNSVQQHLLDLLSKGFHESYSHFFKRTRHLKSRICQILSKNFTQQSQSKKILIISHSCVLSFLLGSELNQKGKIKNKISFDHCIPKRFNHESVLLNQINPSL